MRGEIRVCYRLRRTGNLIRKARKPTNREKKRKVADEPVDSCPATEKRKGILRYYGSGICEGDLKDSRRKRV